MQAPERGTLFDPIRKKRVARTPEEEVRQAMVQYLITQAGYPATFLANEYSIIMGKLSRRCDTVVFSPQLKPLMVFEYKAPDVPISQDTIEQAFRYNSTLCVPFVCLSNGKTTYIYKVGYNGMPTVQLTHLPSYQELQATNE